ncbi:MAG: 4-hydroxy-tetrahydrodipicolinate synthase [Akkermansiaceae bacterium]|nr:4-hydroxy-tetrahydrodipicolinate synthase [Akkermansiaceae bacterium]
MAHTAAAMHFSGTYTALITPFRDGEVDVTAYEALIERQIAGGVDGIVPVGTTGESATLDTAEHIEVIRLAVKAAAGRCQVVAGTGSNSTAEAIELTRAAEEAGATGTLQVCPYYNKPSQEGLYLHFRKIAESTGLPVMLYSVPGRTGIELAPETVARLAQIPNITALKEAGGSVDRVNQLVQAVPEGFAILCGDDPLTLPFIACGAVGLVSVASNLVPDIIARLVRACLNGSFDEALVIQKQFYPLMRGLMGLDVNPVPIKSAVALQGHCRPEFRLPLAPLSEENAAKLKALLEAHGLLA